VSGRDVRVVTIDLAEPWQTIHRRLLDIVLEPSAAVAA
jgi:hypothetical protein